MPTDSPRLAVFDFDGTLIRSDSFGLFLRHAAGRRYLRLLPHMLKIMLQYKRGQITAREGKERLLTLVIRGISKAEFARLMDSFTPLLSKKERPKAMQSLLKHQTMGDRICIVSASPIDWIRPWATRRGICEVYGSPLEFIAERATGKLSGENCQGQKKVDFLERAIPNFADIYEVWSYGDSIGDKELLAVSHHPHYRSFS